MAVRKSKTNPKGKLHAAPMFLVNTRADFGRDRMLWSLNLCNPRAALEAFGDIVGDGQRGAVKLVAKTAAGLKRFILQEVFGLLVKPGS